jgi:hypothetical protein
MGSNPGRSRSPRRVVFVSDPDSARLVLVRRAVEGCDAQLVVLAEPLNPVNVDQVSSACRVAAVALGDKKVISERSLGLLRSLKALGFRTVAYENSYGVKSRLGSVTLGVFRTSGVGES